MSIEASQHEGGGRTEYIRDPQGRVLRVTDYDAQGLMTLDTHYEYDPSGEVVRWRLLDRHGVLFKRFEVISREGDRTETLQYDGNERLEYRFLEEWNESGLVHRTFDPSGRELPETGAA